MKPAYCFRCLCMLVISIFISDMCIAQDSSKLHQELDSTSLNVHSRSRGDTLLIGYDSAYLLNGRIFNLYDNVYSKARNKDASTRELIRRYDSLVNFQDSMLKAKEQYYQDLKQSFDSLASTSIVFADKTDANAKAIDASLNKVNENLNNINRLLDDSLVKLKKQNQQKLKVALGGFSIGIVTAGLIFLFAK